MVHSLQSAVVQTLNSVSYKVRNVESLRRHRRSRGPAAAGFVKMDDEDEIVLRLPVYLRPAEDDTKVCLFQYPLRPRWRPYNLDDLKAARVRPEQRCVELTLGMEVGPTHWDHDSNSPLSTIQLASTSTSKHPTSYAIAMLQVDRNGAPEALSLAPLASIVQLRPSFAQIDRQQQSDMGADGSASAKSTPARRESSSGGRLGDMSLDGADGADDDDDEEDDDMGDAGVTPLPSLLRPAQTEREIEARRSSHAFLVEEREKEPWSTARMHSPDAPAAVAMRQHCFGS